MLKATPRLCYTGVLQVAVYQVLHVLCYTNDTLYWQIAVYKDGCPLHPLNTVSELGLMILWDFGNLPACSQRNFRGEGVYIISSSR